MENFISVFAKMVDKDSIDIEKVPSLIKTKVVAKVKKKKGGKNK